MLSFDYLGTIHHNLYICAAINLFSFTGHFFLLGHIELVLACIWCWYVTCHLGIYCVFIVYTYSLTDNFFFAFLSYPETSHKGMVGSSSLGISAHTCTNASLKPLWWTQAKSWSLFSYRRQGVRAIWSWFSYCRQGGVDSTIADKECEQSSSVLSDRIRDLENKAKSRGESQE